MIGEAERGPTFGGIVVSKRAVSGAGLSEPGWADHQGTGTTLEAVAASAGRAPHIAWPVEEASVLGPMRRQIERFSMHIAQKGGLNECWRPMNERRKGFNYEDYAKQYAGCSDLFPEELRTLSGQCESWYGCNGPFVPTDPELLGDLDEPIESGELCYDLPSPGWCPAP